MVKQKNADGQMDNPKNWHESHELYRVSPKKAERRISVPCELKM